MKDWRFHSVPPPPLCSPLPDVQSLCTHNLSTRRAHNGKYDERDYWIHLCGAGCLCAKKNEIRTERREEEKKNIRIFRIATAAKRLRRHSERVREENNVWMNVRIEQSFHYARTRGLCTLVAHRLCVYMCGRDIRAERRSPSSLESKKKGKMWGKNLARVKPKPYTKIFKFFLIYQRIQVLKSFFLSESRFFPLLCWMFSASAAARSRLSLM